MNPVDFIKFLTNEANEKEELIFYKQLKADKNLEKEFLAVKKVWIAAQLDKTNIPVSRKKQLFNEFWKKRQRPKKFLFSIKSKVFQYAAFFILLLALPVVYFLGEKQNVYPDSYTTISCALGDKTEVVLPDSSKVYLNSGSKLTFNNNFNERQRQIFLEGEAFFSVTKDKSSPFTVKASDIEVKVLGTQFNLKAYPEENKVSATLIEGSLEVSDKKQSVIIKPSQKLIYDKDTKTMQKQLLTDTTPDTEWKEGRLVFRNESLAELELKLERWFDVDIDFADENVKTKHFTGILERESILEAVSYFGYSKYVGYTIKGNDITFYSKN